MKKNKKDKIFAQIKLDELMDEFAEKAPNEHTVIALGSYFTGTNTMEILIEDYTTHKELFKSESISGGSPEIASFLALVQGLKYSEKQGNNGAVHCINKTAIKWYDRREVKCKMKENEENKHVFELLREAEKWIKESKYKPRVARW
ncbi:MAG: hypothetical protein ACLQQ4_12710 [Bacteroidia bacterium]